MKEGMKTYDVIFNTICYSLTMDACVVIKMVRKLTLLVDYLKMPLPWQKQM